MGLAGCAGRPQWCLVGCLLGDDRIPVRDESGPVRGGSSVRCPIGRPVALGPGLRTPMGLPEDEQRQLDRIERELDGADLRFPSSGTTNAAGRRRAFSAGAAWFLGIMLLVAGAVT